MSASNVTPFPLRPLRTTQDAIDYAASLDAGDLMPTARLTVRLAMLPATEDAVAIRAIATAHACLGRVLAEVCPA